MEAYSIQWCNHELLYSGQVLGFTPLVFQFLILMDTQVQKEQTFDCNFLVLEQAVHIADSQVLLLFQFFKIINIIIFKFECAKTAVACTWLALYILIFVLLLQTIYFYRLSIQLALKCTYFKQSLMSLQEPVLLCSALRHNLILM